MNLPNYKFLILGASSNVFTQLLWYINDDIIKQCIIFNRHDNSFSVWNGLYFSKAHNAFVLDDLGKDKIIVLDFSGMLQPNDSINNENILKENIVRISNMRVLTYYYMSSQAVYGKLHMANENSLCQPVCFYGMDKLNAEKTLQNKSDKLGFSAFILRLPNVLGADGFFRAITKGLTPHLLTDAEGKTMRRTFLPPQMLAKVIFETKYHTANKFEVLNIGMPNIMSYRAILDDFECFFQKSKISGNLKLEFGTNCNRMKDIFFEGCNESVFKSWAKTHIVEFMRLYLK